MLLRANISLGNSDSEEDDPTELRRHQFQLCDSAMPLFAHLHALCDQSFQDVMLDARKNAPVSMKEIILKDKAIKQHYQSVVGMDDQAGELLQLLVDYFMKSKQKQIIREQQLAPAAASIALRASLRQQSKVSTAECAKSDGNSLQQHIGAGNIEGVKSCYASLPTARQRPALEQLTTKDLKSLLKLFSLPIRGTKGTLVDRSVKELSKYSSVEGKQLCNLQVLIL